MRKFLDLRRAVKPAFFKAEDPEILPVGDSDITPGAFDIIESDLPKEFVCRMRCAIMDYPCVAMLEDIEKSLELPVLVTRDQIKRFNAKIIIEE